MPKLETKADTSYLLQLPKVSFRIVDDGQASLSQTGVRSEQCRSYGFNDFSEFERPEHYIRYIEPIESELAVQVEYDMDEQDQEWLDTINAERQKEQAGPISYEIFEIIMDKLEKEWFNLIKRIPQPASHLPVEDSRCSVCDDGEGENSNAIVFCDGCNLAVHQDCYGVPYIPEGQWLCRKCTVSPENPVSCIFCPNEGGAFKKTNTGHWSHLLCAIWIPELTVGNAIYMEPVQDVEHLPKSRWKLVCSLCRERVGACIQCDNKTCFTAFHVTCARQAGQLMTMKTLGTEGVLKAFCDKHLPPDMRDALESDGSESEFEDAPKFHRQPRRHSGGRKTAVTTKTARAHAKAYRPGPPIVPRIVVNSLLEYVARVAMRKKQPFVERLCRYWSLKREARRGAPLLKRLHLEPWTASSTTKDQTDEEKAVKLKFLTMLRGDLDKVRMLAELTRKREKEKLKQAHVIKDMVDNFIFPAYGKLRLTLQKISAMDKQDMFLHFVSRVDVPDYYQVIKEPMCWMSIDEKIEQNTYRRIEDFKRDVDLVLENALKYNAPDTTFHRHAKRIQTNSRDLLAELDQLATPLTSDLVNGDTPAETDIGDLEPSRHLIEALILQSGDSQARDMLASLFAFELLPPKEPTPPPPPTPEKVVKKRDNHAERKRRWDEKEARHQERLASGRSTRAGQAIEEAFQHEAGLLPPIPAPEAIPAGISGEAGPGPSTRRTRQSLGNSSSEASRTLDSSSSNPSSRQFRAQVGVAGREIVERLSDKERRAREQELGLEIEAVDNSDQFTRFNTGWILPEGSRRTRHVESPAVPFKPRVRKPKIILEEETESGPSSLPDLEPTTATASSPLSAVSAHDSSLSPPSSDMPSPVRPYPKRGIAAPSPLRQSTSRPSRKRGLSPDLEGEARPSKAARRSTGRQSRRSTQEIIDAFMAGEDESVAGPSKPVRRSSGRQSRRSTQEEIDAFMAGEDESVVEDLVNGDEDEGEDEDMTPIPDEIVAEQEEKKAPAGRGRNANGKGKAAPVEEDEEEEVEEDEGEEEEEAEGEEENELYTPGTLVWAKQIGYPYFPAEVVDPHEERHDLSPLVFKEEARVRAAAKGQKIYLVNFYDKHNTYGWITENKLDMLGEDDDIDQMYLAMKERGKSKAGKSKHGLGVKEGYRQALAVKEPDE